MMEQFNAFANVALLLVTREEARKAAIARSFACRKLGRSSTIVVLGCILCGPSVLDI